MADDIINQKPNMALVIKQAITNMLKDVHTTIPGFVVSFDAETQTAEVQAGIRRIYIEKTKEGTEEKTAVDIPKFINVPVIFPRAGGWCITFPVKEGDECLIHFSERAIDVWRENGEIQDPKDWRMHNFSDAICQLGLSSAPKVITDFDDTNFQIRNEEGDANITFIDDKTIQINTPLKVIVTAPEVEINASTSVIIDSPETTVTGNLTVGGDANIAGTSTAADHDSDGISGKTHVHGNVQPGSGDSGVPK